MVPEASFTFHWIKSTFKRSAKSDNMHAWHHRTVNLNIQNTWFENFIGFRYMPICKSLNMNKDLYTKTLQITTSEICLHVIQYTLMRQPHIKKYETKILNTFDSGALCDKILTGVPIFWGIALLWLVLRPWHIPIKPLKNFDTFTRTSVRESKMNAVGRAQLTI